MHTCVYMCVSAYPATYIGLVLSLTLGRWITLPWVTVFPGCTVCPLSAVRTAVMIRAPVSLWLYLLPPCCVACTYDRLGARNPISGTQPPELLPARVQAVEGIWR